MCFDSSVLEWFWFVSLNFFHLFLGGGGGGGEIVPVRVYPRGLGSLGSVSSWDLSGGEFLGPLRGSSVSSWGF